MRHFLVRAPDGRLLPREAEKVETLKAGMIDGFAVAFEVLDGLQVEPLPDYLPQHNLMSHLTHRYGDQLREWILSGTPVAKKK